MRLIVPLALAAALITPPNPALAAAKKKKAGPPEDRVWIVVRAETREERTAIANCGVPLDDIEERSASGIATPEAVRCLREAGFAIEEMKPLTDIAPKNFPERDSAYYNLQEMNEAIDAMVSANPGTASASSIGTTIQGRDITVIRLNTSPDGPAKPGVLFIGNHHAREHLSTEVPLRMAARLAAAAADPGIGPLLAGRDIYFIPMLNSDGSEYDIESGSYRWQRKNMRDNGNGTTGVDLNRNYGWQWAGRGASNRPGSETYRGPEPFSEPESQAIRDFLNSHTNITVVVSYHSYGSLILYPWSYGYDPIADPKALAVYKAMGDKMGRVTGYAAKQSSDLYASSGDTCDWVWGELKMFCFTFELPGGSFYPGPGAIGPAVDENLKAALYLIEMADDPWRAGQEMPTVVEAPLSAAAAGGKGSRLESEARQVTKTVSVLRRASDSPAGLYDGVVTH